MGPNFGRWYPKLQIILEHNWILYVIIDLAPEVFTSKTHDMIKGTYQKWANDRITMQNF